MRSITPNLTPELSAIVGNQTVAKAKPLPVATFRNLMQHVARLAYANKDHLLFFRGQPTDYKNKAGSSTFYPSIYRGERLARPELDARFDILSSTAKRLSEAFLRERIEGAREVRRRKLIQWSILQHYEVCATPLLDFTQSVRVACSFAFLEELTEDPYVFAFGLPYLTNRVSVNSEQDLVNVRLLSICPPDALRPYFQEGYLAGTDEVMNEFFHKNELDFNNRLVAKFRISRSSKFWSDGFKAIPREALYPGDDRIQRLCGEIRREVGTGAQPSELGAFLQAWSSMKSRLLTLARARTERVYSLTEALEVLNRVQALPGDLWQRLNALRLLRNNAVHNPKKLKSGELVTATTEIMFLLRQLKKVKTLNKEN